ARLHAQHSPRPRREPRRRREVGRCMDRLEPLPPHARRRLPLAAEPIPAGELPPDRHDPLGALGMGAGVVLERGGVVEIERAQGPSRGYRTAPLPAELTEIDVAVVGAGAAGLYAALVAAEQGARVLLISRSPLPQSASYWAQG